MRERVEDLGRIAVLVDKLLEDDFFEKYDWRAKDFCELFSEKSEEERDKIVHFFAYGRQAVFDKLYEISSIALGQDYINDPLSH